MDRKHVYYDDLFLQLKKKHQMGPQTWQASPWLDLKIYKILPGGAEPKTYYKQDGLFDV